MPYERDKGQGNTRDKGLGTRKYKVEGGLEKLSCLVVDSFRCLDD